MTLKQKAMLVTISIFVGILLGSAILQLILMYASAEMIKYALSAILIGFLVYGVYGVVLSRLEYDAKLKELISSKI